MRFKATEEQVKTMAALACNASGGVGMGLIHFNKLDEAKPEEFKLHSLPNGKRELTIDYWRGRMVKLYVRNAPSIVSAAEEPDIWHITARALIEAAGGTVLA